MRRKIAISLCLLLLYCGVTAQQIDDYRHYKLFEEETTDVALIDDNEPIIEVQPNRLWYRSLFDAVPIVQSNRRGVGFYDIQHLFNGVALPKASQSRLSKLSFSLIDRFSDQNIHYTFAPLGNSATSVGVDISTRNYIGGVSGSTAHKLNDKWSLWSDSYIHIGRDLHVEGVFTSEASVALSALGQIDSLRTLSLALFFAPSERANRKAAVAETFSLTGNNLYNPSWGYQSGKVRSANITRKILPTVVGSYAVKLSEKNSLSVSLSATLGEQSQSGLDWLNAATPLPDNYRKLPSYLNEEQALSAVTAVWSNNDSRYTQINFDELYRRNYLQPEAIYLVSERVSRITDIQLCAAMKTSIDTKTTLHYGLRTTLLRSRNFKRADDLLGGNEFRDIDYFLVDDDSFSNMLNNDLEHPDRKVGKNDRYGYHYAINSTAATLFCSVDYTTDRLHLEATAEVGAQRVVRIGYFRKELFADNSLGRSKNLHFAPWALSGGATFNITPQQQIYGHLRAEATAAEGEMLFLQSQYNNRVVENPELAKQYTASVGYKFHNHKLMASATAFLRYIGDQTTVSHLYYDVASAFADVVTSDTSTLNFGIEAEAHYALSEHWDAAIALSASRNTYCGIPHIAVYADADNDLLADEDIPLARGLKLGQTPQISAFGQIGYYSYGWRVNVEAQYHTLRYATPSLILRSESILSHAQNSEVRSEFIVQERLKDAFAMNLSLSKSFYLKKFSRKVYSTSVAPSFTDRHPHSRITIFATVNNLLGNNNIYRSYESSRIRKHYLWEGFYATAQPSYILYAYPRTYHISIRFSF